VQEPENIIITADPFSPEDRIAAFRARLKNAGALVSFTGVVRDVASVSAGVDEVTALHLQHYPGFTERQISAFAQTALDRFDIENFLIIHRVGKMTPSDPIVLVAVAAIHRRAAFEAADYLMDYLKTSAPFWKKEMRGTQSVWIEPRKEDYSDKARWKQQDDTKDES
jgi:molybdopterin synthase catalytic subunit